MKEIVASVAGRLMACHVEVGAEIQLGAEVFTVESMKMEIPVVSEWAGQITQLLANVGDNIEEGQVLALLLI